LAPNPVIDELWCETMDDMQNFYRENEAQLKPVETLEKDRLYAVKTNELWARALFSEFDETGDVSCIDIYTILEKSISKLSFCLGKF
jgi:hypothetical protein